MVTISPNLSKDLKMRPMDGPASTALETGRGIFAIYTLIYPLICPLISRGFCLTGMFAYDRSLCSIGTR